MTREKQRYLARMAKLRSASVASVRSVPAPVTDQDRAEHLAKVSGKLEEIANRGQLGGSVTAPKDRKMVRPELTDAQVEALAAKWRSGVGHTKLDDVTFLSDIGIDLGTGEARPRYKEIIGEDGKPSLTPIIYCSFCDSETDDSRATEGRGKANIRRFEDVTFIHGEPVVTEKTVVFADKLVACPNCILHLLPYENRKGELVKPMKFKETEG